MKTSLCNEWGIKSVNAHQADKFTKRQVAQIGYKRPGANNTLSRLRNSLKTSLLCQSVLSKCNGWGIKSVNAHTEKQ